MNLKSKAWALLCDLARLRGTGTASVGQEAYRMAREITGGTPWADCLTPEWEMLVAKLGGLE